MAAQLTSGSIQQIYAESGGGSGSVVQVLDVKRIQSGDNHRFRLVVSDGQHYQQAMLATQLNGMVGDGPEDVKLHCILKLDEIICNMVQDRRIIIILGATVLSQHGSKIGTPSNVEQAAKTSSAFGGSQASAAPAPAPAASSASGSNPYMKSGGGGAQRPVVQNSGNTKFLPISSLNPYVNKWTIKAKVMNKGDIRTWNNARGEGKLFSFDCADEHGGEIRATFFKEGVDKYYEMLQVGKTYKISKCNLKTANQQYNTCKNEYELNGDGNSLVELCDDIAVTVNYEFKNLTELSDGSMTGKMIDVIAAVSEVKDIRSITTRRGDQCSVLDLMLADDSNASVSCSLWGKAAENFNAPVGTIIAMKGVKVGDFNGVSLSAMGSSQTEINPSFPRACEMKAWYEAGGASGVQSLSVQGGGGARGPTPRKTLAQIKDENLGQGEKPDWFESRGVVTFIKHDATWHYVAAPESKKKCIENGDGTWQCEAENKTYQANEVIRRYILSITVNDHTGVQWFSGFDDVGQKLLGMTADELYKIKETEGGEAEFEKVFAKANFQDIVVKAKAKFETYQDESRLKCTAQELNSINYRDESSKMLGDIKEMLARA